LAAKAVNCEVYKAGLVGVLGSVGDTNIQGEDQQKLDVCANENLIQTELHQRVPFVSGSMSIVEKAESFMSTTKVLKYLNSS
tara:strand:- start:77 stop:322 length:246 start_codon:yes stop_codon:yes gene_type:complete